MARRQRIHPLFVETELAADLASAAHHQRCRNRTRTRSSSLLPGAPVPALSQSRQVKQFN